MSIDFIFVFFFAAFQKINIKVWLHKIAIKRQINSFLPILNPFSGVFKGCKMETLSRNGLIH